MKTKIIAHRGDTVHHIENTLPAFISACTQGADGIELDVHFSADKELVVHHDSYLGNPDNGSGLIFTSNYTDLKKLRIGDNDHIPTLDEVLDELGDTMHYEIELKTPNEAFLRKVLEAVMSRGLIGNVEFTSPNPYVLTKLKELEPSCVVGNFVPAYPEWMGHDLGAMLTINNALLGKINVIHCPIADIDADLITEAHKHGLLVHAADCNDETSLQKAFALGIDQLSTSDIAQAVRLRDDFLAKK